MEQQIATDPTKHSVTTPEPTVRILTSGDKEQVLELFRTQPMIMKQSKDNPYVAWFKTFIDLCLRPDPRQAFAQPSRMIGAFNGDTLISYMGQKEWETFPFWTVVNLHVRREVFNVMDMTANGLGKCLDTAAAIAEKRDRFTFYWVTDADHWNVREKAWSRASTTMKRYIILTERVCPPGTRPPYPYEAQMIGGRTWTRPLAIKSAHLKKGYRHQIFFDRGLLKEPFVDLQGTGY